MAITAATSSIDRIIKSSANNGKSLFDSAEPVVSSASTWLQGDLICYDTTDHILRVVAATTDAATLVGIADNVVTSGKLAGPYDGLTAVNAAQVTPDFVGPKYAVVASLKLLTGDSAPAGALLYLADAADTQTVSVTDPGDGLYIGFNAGPAIVSAPAGTLIQVYLIARYPGLAIG